MTKKHAKSLLILPLSILLFSQFGVSSELGSSRDRGTTFSKRKTKKVCRTKKCREQRKLERKKKREERKKAWAKKREERAKRRAERKKNKPCFGWNCKKKKEKKQKKKKKQQQAKKPTKGTRGVTGCKAIAPIVSREIGNKRVAACYMKLFTVETTCRPWLSQAKGNAGNPHSGYGLCSIEKDYSVRKYRGPNCAKIDTVESQIRCCRHLMKGFSKAGSYFGPVRIGKVPKCE